MAVGLHAASVALKDPAFPWERGPHNPTEAFRYLLTPQGEGWVLAWFKGVLIDNDAGLLKNGGCNTDCPGELLERGQSEWWVQLRNSRGVTG